jgi:ribosome-associated protein
MKCIKNSAQGSGGRGFGTFKKNMEEKSKTRKKKEALSLQELGERLVKLSNDLIGDMELPAEIYDAVMFAKTVKKHGARRRQLQYIGTLMRKYDPSAIQEALHNLDAGNERKATAFQKLERWRDELIAGNEALMEEIVRSCPDAGRQQLSQLARQARKEMKTGKPPKASRALFRYLRSVCKEAHQL